MLQGLASTGGGGTAKGELPLSQMSSAFPRSQTLFGLQAMLQGLESTDWVEVVEALTFARRLATHHSAVLHSHL